MALINYEHTFEVLAEEIADTAASKGFWDMEGIGDFGLIPLKLALIHSEVSEALEVHRKQYEELDDFDVLTGMTPMQEEDFIEELVDIVIRVLDIVGYYDYSSSFAEIFMAKMEKNSERPYRHGKNY